MVEIRLISVRTSMNEVIARTRQLGNSLACVKDALISNQMGKF